jgi:hypothetical protein
MRKSGSLTAVAAVALALVGCGGGGDSSSSSSGSETVTLSNGETMTKPEAIDLIFEKAPAAFKLVCAAIEREGEDGARKSFEKGFHLAFKGEQLTASEVFEAAAERC